MKTKLIVLCIAAIMGCFTLSAQPFVKGKLTKVGIICVDGLAWSTNYKQDSVINIYIERDTMAVIRALLVHYIQVKEEGDAANMLLSIIDLNILQKVINSREYDIYLKEYKYISNKNIKYRKNHWPQYFK
jgi:hypothetical protein